MIKKIRVILFFLVIAAVPVLILVLPKETVSYNENKILATMPSFSAKTYFDREFANGFTEYLSDHFPIRESFIKAKNTLSSALGDFETDGTVCTDDRLIELFRMNSERKNTVLKSQKAINNFASMHDNVYVALAPTAQEIYKDDLPEYYSFDDEKTFCENFTDGLKNVRTVDLISPLCANKDDYIYYRADHHWTENGAYLAYKTIMKSFGTTYHKNDDYVVEEKSDAFLGTLFSKTLNSSIEPDKILKYSLSGHEQKISLEVQDSSRHEVKDSLYYEKFLDEKDKYSYYLGGNRGIVTAVNESSESDETLLVIKDSFANSLIPFLSDYFREITVVDLRYARINDLTTINADSFSRTLILYNVIGFADEGSVVNLDKIK